MHVWTAEVNYSIMPKPKERTLFGILGLLNNNLLTCTNYNITKSTPYIHYTLFTQFLYLIIVLYLVCITQYFRIYFTVFNCAY